MSISFALIFILSVNSHLYSSASSIPPEVIDADALLISKLARHVKELSPPVVRQFVEASCHMVTECCGQSSAPSAALMSLFNVTEFLQECFGEIHSLQYEERVQSCQPLLTMNRLAGDNQMKQYLFLTTMKNSDEVKSIGSVCSKDEIEKIICDWNNVEEHRVCRRKLMIQWAQDHDEGTYQSKVEQLKDDYNQIIEELNKKNISN